MAVRKVYGTAQCHYGRNFFGHFLIPAEPSASGRLQILPSGKEDQFAPLLTVPLRLSSDHWLFSRKSERKGHAPSFPFEFWFLYSVLMFRHSTQPPSGILLARDWSRKLLLQLFSPRRATQTIGAWFVQVKLVSAFIVFPNWALVKFNCEPQHLPSVYLGRGWYKHASP